MVDFATMGRYRQQFIQATHRYDRAKRTLDDLESTLTAGGVEDVPALLDQIETAKADCAAAAEEYADARCLYMFGCHRPEPQEAQTRWYTSFGVPAQPQKR